MSCPNCKGTDYELVEVDEKYQKVECFECGLSGPMVPLNGKVSDEKAYELWDKISFEADQLMEFTKWITGFDPYEMKGSKVYCSHCQEYVVFDRSINNPPYIPQDIIVKDSHKPDCMWFKAWLYVQEKEGKSGTNPG